MNEACDTDDFEEMVDYSKLSSDEVQGKLIWFWFRFFRLNKSFEQYCDARRSDDDLTRKRLEKEFSKIEELYVDWGDIHILPDMYHDDLIEWQEWLASKRWLFFIPPAKLLEPPIASVEAGSVLLSIPSGLDKNKLKKLFDEFVDSHSEIVGDGPRYIPMKIKGQSQSEILERLDKAELVNDLVSGEDEFKYSHAEIAKLVLQIPFLRKLGFNWHASNTQKIMLANGTLSHEDVAHYKRTLINLNKFFKKSIEDTIHGQFPASL